MSSVQNEEIHTLVACLKQTYTATDKETREAAEKKMLEFEKNLIPFTHLLFEVIKSDNPEIDEPTKLSIILHLNRIVSKNLLINQIPKNEKIEIMKLYLNYLCLPSPSNKHLTNMSNGFSTILDSIDNEPQILPELTNLLLSNIQNVALNSMKGVIMILNSIVNCNALTKGNIITVIGQLISISKCIIEVVMHHLDSGEWTYEKNPKMFTYINETLTNLYALFFFCIFKLKKRISSSGISKEDIIKAFNIFIPIGIKILFRDVQNNFMISWTGVYEVDTSVNSLKISIMKFINASVLYLSSYINDEETQQIHTGMIKMILLNLEYLINTKIENLINMPVNETENSNDPASLSNNYKYSTLISHLLIYISRISEIETFKMDLTPLETNLFKNILLPMMIISKEELDDCVSPSSYDSFSINIEDVISRNKNKTIKSSVSMLIKTLYKSNKNTKIFICRYTLALLVKSLGSTADLSKNFSFENDKIEMLLQNDNEKKIDLCLLVLCIIGECEDEVPENNSLINEIQDVFNKHLQLLLNPSLAVHIKHKVCLFIKQYVYVFYSIDDDNFMVLLEYLFQSMLLIDQLIISKEASEVLSDILSNYKTSEVDLATPLITKCLPNIISVIKNTKVLNFFDVLMEIKVKCVKTDFDAEIFLNLCKRIDMEVERHSRLKFKLVKDKNHKSSKSAEQYNYQLLINKCFNTVRVMINDKAFVIGNLKTIAEAMNPLFAHMKNVEKIDFDEDLISIMTNIIRHLKSIPDFGFEFLIYLYKYLEKVGGMFLDLYELMNVYIVYGGKIIEQNQNYLEAIINIFNASMNNIKNKKSPFYVCCLIQIWLMNSNTIPEKAVIHFVDCCIDKINSLYSEPNWTFENCCNYSSFIVLLYVACINYAPICLGELNKVNKLAELVEWTNKILDFDYLSYYQIKILVLSISHLVKSEYFVKDCETFLNFGYLLLQKQRKGESNELKKLLKKDINCNFIYESDEEGNNPDNESDEEDDGLGFDNEKEIKDLINRTINPIKDQDEFQIYKTSVEEFKLKNRETFDKWISSLSDTDKTKLNSVLEMKRIIVKKNDLQFSIPRKIVTIKRKIPTPNA